MGKTVVVANAPWRWRPEFVALVRAAERVFAADGGANHLARIGVRPEAVVGDLDSILPGVRRWIGEERMILEPDQDFTDLHKTLAHAFDTGGASDVTVLAATGGRLDHALENLMLLARWGGRGSLELRDEQVRAVPVVGRGVFTTQPGQTISLMPAGRCERVWTRGLRWPLDGEPLDLTGRTSVSNFAEGTEVQVRVEGGAVLVFLAQAVAEG